MRSGQAQKQTEFARQARQEPTGPHVRVQADADFRHGQPAAGRDDAHRRALQQAHAAAQHITVTPADQRFGVGVQAIVEAIFGGKKLCAKGGYFARVFKARLGQAAYLATGAERLGAIAAQQHADDLRVFGPGLQAVAEGQDHRQGEGVERLFSVQAGDADTGTAAAGEFFEVQIHRDLNRESEGSV